MLTPLNFLVEPQEGSNGLKYQVWMIDFASANLKKETSEKYCTVVFFSGLGFFLGDVERRERLSAMEAPSYSEKFEWILMQMSFCKEGQSTEKV